MTQSPLGKPYKETIYNENYTRFYRCFVVPKENIELKEVSDILCEIPNFKKTIQPDYHTIWYLFEITPEEYKQRKLDINKEALETTKKAGLDEDMEVSDELSSDMIDKKIKKRISKYEKKQSKNKDEDIVICDGLTDSMIDRFYKINDMKG